MLEPNAERDLAVCAMFLRRGAQRWRNPANDYTATASGLIDALKDELSAGIPRPEVTEQEQMERRLSGFRKNRHELNEVKGQTHAELERS